MAAVYYDCSLQYKRMSVFADIELYKQKVCRRSVCVCCIYYCLCMTTVQFHIAEQLQRMYITVVYYYMYDYV